MDKSYMDVEDLDVYQRLCKLHIEVCDLSHDWPQEERYELGSQVRRASNSSPAQLAEKHDDRHIRNKIEGVNRSRGEAGETMTTCSWPSFKGYIDQSPTAPVAVGTRSAFVCSTVSKSHWRNICPNRSGGGLPETSTGLKRPEL